ncbi:MAG TPA: ISNCY family transposase [Gemmatimonadaceae bacterium]
MARIKAKTLTLTTAAGMLGVSYRQTKRLWRRYRQGGAKALQHQAVGRPSNRGTPSGVRQRALTLIREKYSGAIGERFGPTLAAEHLASEDGLRIHHETLRRWMIAAGLWSRARKRLPYRQRRARRAHAGELVQLDGSFHAWFEQRAPTQPCLITLVDDATSQSLGWFSPQETIWAAVDVLRTWIETHGIPQALYTDWKNVYVRVANEAERATGEVPRTQFGRMCDALGIQIIAANSPQAKGRIERNHGTHQDRLVKKLRRLAIGDLDAANAFLTQTYWPEHNARFSRPAASPDDMHRRAPTARQLDHIFHLEETRAVSEDWIVRYHNRSLQLERQSGHAPARSTVTVCEWRDGRLAIEYRGRAVKWHEWTAAPLAVPAASGATKHPSPGARARRPSDDHPWRRGHDDGLPKVTLWQAMTR